MQKIRYSEINKLAAITTTTILILCCITCIREANEIEIKEKLIKTHKISRDWKKIQFVGTLFNDITNNFKHPTSLELFDNNPNLYFIDSSNHEVISCNIANNKVISRYGKLGTEISGSFYFPFKLRKIEDNQFLVPDGNMTMRIFNLEYDLIDHYHVYHIINDLVVNNKIIYANCVYFDQKDHPLIEVFDLYGRKLSEFGDRIDRKEYLSFDSQAFLTLGNKEIIIGFEHYPIIRRYSLDSSLIKEIRIHVDILTKLVQYNSLKWFSKPAPGKLKLVNLISGIKYHNNKIYVLLKLPRIELIEMSIDGDIENYYYADQPKNIYLIGDFILFGAPESEKLITIIYKDTDKPIFCFYNLKNRQ